MPSLLENSRPVRSSYSEALLFSCPGKQNMLMPNELHSFPFHWREKEPLCEKEPFQLHLLNDLEEHGNSWSTVAGRWNF